jgi:hypothetical protein
MVRTATFVSSSKFLLQNKVLRSIHKDSRRSTYYFFPGDEEWIVNEEIYVSETSTADYWQITHQEHQVISDSFHPALNHKAFF